MIKVITSDVDGILTDLEKYQHWMVKDYFTKRGKKVPKIVNQEAYDIADKYEITKKRRQIIWLEYFKNYCLSCEPWENAFETLKYWQESGTKIGIVTARAFATNPLLGPLARKWYEEWQAMYDFVPDEIIWCPEKNSGPSKAKACIDLKSELMLEDKIDNIENILDVCDTIAIETSYNENYQPINKPYDFYMVEDWSQIRKQVDTIEKKLRRFK